LKKNTFVLVVFASAMVMVLPLIRGVNHPANNAIGIAKTLRADGAPRPVPLPPPPPGLWTAASNSLVADGRPRPVPLPPPGPPLSIV
jgi:hypothetical protein